MKLTEIEKQLALDIGERCRQYNFFVLENGEMYFDKESPKRLTMNHLKCMLRADFKEVPVSRKRFERLMECSIEALLIMTKEQIGKQLNKTAESSKRHLQ